MDPPAGFWSVLGASRCVAGSGAAAGGKAFQEGERRPHVEISVEMQSSSGAGSPTRGAGRSVSISLEPGGAGRVCLDKASVKPVTTSRAADTERCAGLSPALQ